MQTITGLCSSAAPCTVASGDPRPWISSRRTGLRCSVCLAKDQATLSKHMVSWTQMEAYTMSGKLDSLYRLQRKDTAQAGEVLADAFQHDPVWNAIFGDVRPEQKAHAFETPVRYCLRYGEVYAPSAHLEGAAAWVPGALADMTLWRVLRSGAMWPGTKLGTRIARKMVPVFRPIEADRRENMRGRSYIYLQVIGVAPAFQGQGFGGKLLRALIEKSEQAGMPLYLETETEDNVRMYERFGFQVVKEITLPTVHLPMWEMVRGKQMGDRREQADPVARRPTDR